MVLDLDEIRKKIDETDRELISIFCKRMDLVKQVAAYKIEMICLSSDPTERKLCLTGCRRLRARSTVITRVIFTAM